MAFSGKVVLGAAGGDSAAASTEDDSEEELRRRTFACVFDWSLSMLLAEESDRGREGLLWRLERLTTLEGFEEVST